MTIPSLTPAVATSSRLRPRPSHRANLRGVDQAAASDFGRMPGVRGALQGLRLRLTQQDLVRNAPITTNVSRSMGMANAYAAAARVRAGGSY